MLRQANCSLNLKFNRGEGMNREDLRELIQGPIATVPTPFDDDFEVDYGRMR